MILCVGTLLLVREMTMAEMRVKRIEGEGKKPPLSSVVDRDERELPESPPPLEVDFFVTVSSSTQSAMPSRSESTGRKFESLASVPQSNSS